MKSDDILSPVDDSFTKNESIKKNLNEDLDDSKLSLKEKRRKKIQLQLHLQEQKSKAGNECNDADEGDGMDFLRDAVTFEMQVEEDVSSQTEKGKTEV